MDRERVLTVTLDVNVLASGLVGERGTPARILEYWSEGHFSLVVSEHILHVLSRALEKRYFHDRFPPARRASAFTLLRITATIVMPANDVDGIAPDAEDDMILATAVAGSVHFLVTGDKPLQALGSVRGISIISPRDFLDVLESHTQPPPLP